MLGKGENESGGQQGGAETARCRFKAAGREGGGACSHDAEWGGSGMRPGRAVPRSAGVKTAPTSGPGRSAAGRGAWAVAWCGLGAAAGLATPRRAAAGPRVAAGLSGEGERRVNGPRKKGPAGRNRGREWRERNFLFLFINKIFKSHFQGKFEFNSNFSQS